MDIQELKSNIKYLALVDLIDVGFNINISTDTNMISVEIKYDVPLGDDYEDWLQNNSNARSVIVTKSRLVDSNRFTNRECLGNFSYKYHVKKYTDILTDYLKSYGYKLHCAYSQKNGMRFSKHGQNTDHICDYPYKLKIEYKIS